MSVKCSFRCSLWILPCLYSGLYLKVWCSYCYTKWFGDPLHTARSFSWWKGSSTSTPVKYLIKSVMYLSYHSRKLKYINKPYFEQGYFSCTQPAGPAFSQWLQRTTRMARPGAWVQQIDCTVRKSWTCCSQTLTHKLIPRYSRTIPGGKKIKSNILKRICEEPLLEGFLQPLPGTSSLRATPGITWEAFASNLIFFFLVPFLSRWYELMIWVF